MQSNRSRSIWLLIAVTVVAGGIATTVFHRSTRSQASAVAAPITGVTVSTLTSQTVNDWRDYSGRLEAVEKVDVRPLVTGTITKVHFTSGSLVKKGDVLFTIDPRPYAAEVRRASAALAAAEARAAYTRSDFTRAEHLVTANAIPQRDYEEKQNLEREAQANLQNANALLETARLNLEHTGIVAPISGRVSRAEITVGNVVMPGATSSPLTSIVSISPIYASFDVDEQTLLRYIGTQRNKKVPVFMGLSTDGGYPREGTIDSVDNRLDTASGTVRVRAIFDNKDGGLMPGLYARIRLSGGAPHRGLLLSDQAIGVDQDKRFVLVIDASNHALYREIQLGGYQDGFRVVTSGLREGERIVADGAHRARPGDLVRPADALAAGNAK